MFLTKTRLFSVCSKYVVSARCRKFSLGAMKYSSFALIGGNKIHYEKAGTGKHNILCLPGILGSGLSDFKRQIEGSIDHSKFTIIAWDAPGHGRSRPPNRSFEGEFYHRDADVAFQLMQQLKLTPFSMLGWSIGGTTAMILAQRYPSVTRKVVVWGAFAFISKEDVAVANKVRDISAWSPEMRAPLEALYGQEYFKDTWDAWMTSYVDGYKSGGDICKKELKGIRCPTLIIHGMKDAMVGFKHAEYLKENISNARLVKMDEAKHNLHMRYPQKFSEVVEPFLLEDHPQLAKL